VRNFLGDGDLLPFVEKSSRIFIFKRFDPNGQLKYPGTPQIILFKERGIILALSEISFVVIVSIIRIGPSHMAETGRHTQRQRPTIRMLQIVMLFMIPVLMRVPALHAKS